MRDHSRSKNVTFHATGVADFDGSWKTWRMRKMQTIADELGHEMSAVSMIKLDVEEWEWKVLPQALSSHALDEVSQLLVELHVTIKPQPRRERYLHALLTLAGLYRFSTVLKRQAAMRSTWLKYIDDHRITLTAT
ncbi:upf0624 protein sw [Plakobranchus ocellatus]|uniref:Upf0624 protein sw n=1 Tax=Plakobranchus ocellatus TaxID=259542 RepID=A0AAV4B3J3_9GAST|nr:upf0624 protein sw [Plakobranchus ocellatus]